MPLSLRFTYPTSKTPRPLPPASLSPPSSPTSAKVPAAPIDDVSRVLRLHARVPTAGMHSSNHTSDAVRTHVHLSNIRVVDLEPLDPIPFDDIAVRETDLPPNPDDDDELPSLQFPNQSLHNRPPSPPQFRDLNLPTLQTRRPEELDIPRSIASLLPDDIATNYTVPFPLETTGFGRRIPSRTEPLPPPPPQQRSHSS